MKRYDSITAIKAISCLMVFLSHWSGAFSSWGHVFLDRLFIQSPFRIMTFGNMAVCIFLMLSGTLAAMKIYRGGTVSWGTEMIKRYLRMAVPVFGTHLLVYFLFHLNLFRTGEAAFLMGNDWLGCYYRVAPSLWNVVKNSFITSVFSGDSSLYGPLWMMNYIFFGTVFSILLAEALSQMSRRAKIVVQLLLLGAFLVLDSYYVCFLMGNIVAQLLLWLEKLCGDSACRSSDGKQSKIAISLASVVLFFGGWKLALKSFALTAFLQGLGVTGALGNASFWGMIGGFLLSCGFISFWELWEPFVADESQKMGKRVVRLLVRPFLWVGERSYSVFLVHWLVICTFSCGFYCRFVERPNWFYLGVNFFLTTAVLLICTEIFYILIEKAAFTWAWNRIKVWMMSGRGSDDNTGK